MDNFKLLAKRPRPEVQGTRRSLLLRLEKWEDNASWTEFFDTYWRLIYAVARQAGLDEEDAQDVVQNTIVSVAKQIGRFKYDPAVCSFKGWLLTLTRRRIADQFRKRRGPVAFNTDDPHDDRSTPVIERIPSPTESNLDSLWDSEWERNLLEVALDRVKRKANPKGFEIFYLHVIQDQSAREVARTLGINIAQVYLAKHRISALLKKEITGLETYRL
jgi:RNA polymerase sigma factor (sigma-70 family)